MNEQKTDFILKKDLPDLKAGAVFKWDEDYEKYISKIDSRLSYSYSEEQIKSNTDWFEIVEPKEFTESDMRAIFFSNLPQTNTGFNSALNKIKN